MNEANVERKESQSSYEVGKPQNRHKIYYWTTEELVKRLQELKEAGLIEVE